MDEEAPPVYVKWFGLALKLGVQGVESVDASMSTTFSKRNEGWTYFIL